MRLRECIKCEHKSSICGQLFTQGTCELCGAKKMYPNTRIPKICKDCSVEHNKCQRCGENLE